MTTALEAPGADLGIEWPAARFRTRTPVDGSAGVDAIEWRDIETGEILATVGGDELLGGEITEEIDGFRIRTSLTWELAADHPARTAITQWCTTVLLWPDGVTVDHIGPALSRSSSVDMTRWLDEAVCPHPFPGDEERAKWDIGAHIPMRLGWEHQVSPAIGGGELTSPNLHPVAAYAGKTGADVCDLVVSDEFNGDADAWWWAEALPDGTVRISWGRRGRVVPRDEVELSCIIGDRDTATDVDHDEDWGQMVSAPVIIARDGRQTRRTPPSIGPQTERAFPAAPGSDEGPWEDQVARMGFQAVIETVPVGEGFTATVADRTVWAKVRAGDMVWLDADKHGVETSAYYRVLRRTRPLGDGPLTYVLGFLPPRELTDFFRETAERIKALEDEQKGARSSDELTDWDVQTTDSAGTDPAKQDRIPAAGKVPTWQMLRNGGVERLMLTPGDRVAKPGEKVSVAETIASGMASIVVPGPDPDRRWTAQIVVFADEASPSGDLWSGTVFGTSLASWTFSPLPPGVGVVALSVLTKSGTLTVQGDVGQDLHLSWFTGGSTVIDGGTFGAQLEFTLI